MEANKLSCVRNKYSRLKIFTVIACIIKNVIGLSQTFWNVGHLIVSCRRGTQKFQDSVTFLGFICYKILEQLDAICPLRFSGLFYRHHFDLIYFCSKFEAFDGLTPVFSGYRTVFAIHYGKLRVYAKI